MFTSRFRLEWQRDATAETDLLLTKAEPETTQLVKRDSDEFLFRLLFHSRLRARITWRCCRDKIPQRCAAVFLTNWRSCLMVFNISDSLEVHYYGLVRVFAPATYTSCGRGIRQPCSDCIWSSASWATVPGPGESYFPDERRNKRRKDLVDTVPAAGKFVAAYSFQ